MERMAEQKRLEKKLLATVILIVVGCILLGITHWYLNPKYQELQAFIGNTASIARDISAVEKQKADYQKLLDESGKEYSNLFVSKNDFVSFLGEITMQNGLNINKMTVDDVTTLDSGMYSMKVELELQGELYDVKNLVQQLYDADIVSRIDAFSYRLQSENELLWMWRTIDDITLVPWWDLSNKEGTITITGIGEDEPPLGADDLLEHGTALCYLEIEFLGVGG